MKWASMFEFSWNELIIDLQTQKKLILSYINVVLITKHITNEITNFVEYEQSTTPVSVGDNVVGSLVVGL